MSNQQLTGTNITHVYKLNHLYIIYKSSIQHPTFQRKTKKWSRRVGFPCRVAIRNRIAVTLKPSLWRRTADVTDFRVISSWLDHETWWFWVGFSALFFEKMFGDWLIQVIFVQIWGFERKMVDFQPSRDDWLRLCMFLGLFFNHQSVVSPSGFNNQTWRFNPKQKCW
jgi:hypothetical protein